jgi:hypothetical protein
MNKIFVSIISLFFFAELTSSAAVYKGQRMYVKEYRGCHGGGQGMAASKRAREWKKMLNNDGEELVKVHADSKKAEKSWDYFKSNNFQSNSKHLKDFLMEYSKDSGKVPACN